jgi:ABC-type spermidine/putrescine transport system permease subunit II
VKVATVTGVLVGGAGYFCCLCAGALPALPGRTLFSGMVNAPLVMPEVVIGLSLLLLDGGRAKRLWLATSVAVDHCVGPHAAGHGLWHGGHPVG